MPEKDYLIMNDLLTDPMVNGTARAVELMKRGAVKGESFGTEHLRVYEMLIYAPGELEAAKALEQAADMLKGKGELIDNVSVPLDTLETKKTAHDAGKDTPAEELVKKGYVVVSNTSKEQVMGLYRKPEPPALIKQLKDLKDYIDVLEAQLTDAKKLIEELRAKPSEAVPEPAVTPGKSRGVAQEVEAEADSLPVMPETIEMVKEINKGAGVQVDEEMLGCKGCSNEGPCPTDLRSVATGVMYDNPDMAQCPGRNKTEFRGVINAYVPNLEESK